MKNLFKAGGFVIICTASFSFTGICSHSYPRASYMLMQKGFTQVTNMEYGMSEWKNKVKPTACNNKLYIKQ